MDNLQTKRLYTWTYKDKLRFLYLLNAILVLSFTLPAIQDSILSKNTPLAITFLIMTILIIVLYSLVFLKTKKPVTVNLVFGKDTIEYWLNNKDTTKIDDRKATLFERLGLFTRLNNLEHYTTSEISEILLSPSKGQIIIRLRSGKKGLLSLAALKDTSTLERIVEEVNQFSESLSL
jgi:hypothetical protein